MGFVALIFSFVGFAFGSAFLIWFVVTLFSINKRLGIIARNTEPNRLSVARLDQKPCPQCNTPIPAQAVYCVFCGSRAT